MRDNLGKRPVFFSWSDGGYPDQTFGLSAYLVSQGLVRKLMPTPVTANDSIVLSPGLGYVDLPRTRAMLMRACDVRLPPRLTRGELDFIAAALLGAAEDVMAARREMAA